MTMDTNDAPIITRPREADFASSPGRDSGTASPSDAGIIEYTGKEIKRGNSSHHCNGCARVRRSISPSASRNGMTRRHCTARIAPWHSGAHAWARIAPWHSGAHAWARIAPWHSGAHASPVPERPRPGFANRECSRPPGDRGRPTRPTPCRAAPGGPTDRGGARGRLEDARQHFQGRGLAGAVGSKVIMTRLTPSRETR
jgi:hypothetical protein